jgi:hypothetical protein
MPNKTQEDYEANKKPGESLTDYTARKSRETANKSKEYSKEQDAKAKAGDKSARPLTDRLADPDPTTQQDATQELNRNRQSMTDAQKQEAGLPKNEVYDPGDTDGNNKAVSPEDGNLTGGDPKSGKKEDEDPFKDTKAAWDHLASVFGDKVTALQSELEGRLGAMMTPTDRETGNPFAGDDVPASKEMGLGDLKAVVAQDVDDVKNVASGIGEIGKAAAGVAGNAVREGTRATIKDMGYDPNEVGEAISTVGKAAKGLGGLFASDNSDAGSKVPDGNWKPKSINDLFK